MSGADEIFELATDFGKAPAKVASGLFDAYRGAGEGFRDDWRHNARATSPRGHLKHLPAAITSEMKVAGFGIAVVTGPQTDMPQGGLGLIDELGSSTSPPHLNGLRAMPLAEKRLERLADAAIGLALP